jgi:hypothetical protein
MHVRFRPTRIHGFSIGADDPFQGIFNMWRIGIMSKIYVTKSALGDLMFYSGTDAGVIEFNDFLGGRLEE